MDRKDIVGRAEFGPALEGFIQQAGGAARDAVRSGVPVEAMIAALGSIAGNTMASISTSGYDEEPAREIFLVNLRMAYEDAVAQTRARH